MKKAIKYLCPTVTLLFCLFLLGSCGRKQTISAGGNSITLWVVTEASKSDGMNLQAEIIAKRMEETYENLTVKLDILPRKEQEREVYLKQLRAQIMVGKGPDVYLLPTGDTLTIRDSQIYDTQIQIAPLFPDIELAMRNGVFTDIQKYYAEDLTLETDKLKKEIMDAGVIGECRYVLPLRFTVPVLLTNQEKWEKLGLSQKLADSNITALTETMLSSRNGKQDICGIQLPTDLSLLPTPLDYEKGEVLLSAEEIAGYMRLYQSWYAPAAQSLQAYIDKGESIINSNPYWIEYTENTGRRFTLSLDRLNEIWVYLSDGIYWNTLGLPLFTSNLADTLDTLAIATVAKEEITMFPLLATDGSLTASVTYFGAVGNNCKNPTLAYHFLREFLTEEFQWDIYRPRIEKIRGWGQEHEPQNKGQVEDSWPVRVIGSVAYLWDNRQYQESNYFNHGGSSITRQIKFRNANTVLTDTDLPALSWPIDVVRFPVILGPENSLEHALSLLNDENGNPTDVDIDALAEQVYLALWWHIGEG